MQARNKGEEAGMASSFPVTHFEIYIPLPCHARVYEPRGLVLTKGHSPLNFKLQLLPGHFKYLGPRNQRARKGVTNLEEVIDLGHQKEVGLLSHKSRKEYFLSPR